MQATAPVSCAQDDLLNAQRDIETRASKDGYPRLDPQRLQCGREDFQGHRAHQTGLRRIGTDLLQPLSRLTQMTQPSDFLIIERLTRVEEKIDNFLLRMLDQADRSDDHEARIRALEGDRQRLLGVSSLVVLLISVFGAALVSWLFAA